MLPTPEFTAASDKRQRATALLESQIAALEGAIAVQVSSTLAKQYLGRCKRALAEHLRYDGYCGTFIFCDFGRNGLGPAIEDAVRSCHRRAAYDLEAAALELAA